MFRAKYPVEARRTGNFETMHWEPDGSEGEQRDLEEAKRVIREVSFILLLLLLLISTAVNSSFPKEIKITEGKIEGTRGRGRSKMDFSKQDKEPRAG